MSTDSTLANDATLRRRRADVLVLAAIGAGIGWIWLVASVAALMPTTDLGTLGPGMAVFDWFSDFATLPETVRASLRAICSVRADRPLTSVDIADMSAMWGAMVLAMMLPSAAPALSFTADASRGRVAAAIILMLGYLAAWGLFAALATALQVGLMEAERLNPRLGSMAEVLATTTIAAAGVYQFTPWKAACLQRCRTPAPVFLGPASRAFDLFRTGLRLGADCLGCCWALMTVMFAVGVMNLLWIAALSVVMLLEKLTLGAWVSRLVGIALVLLAVALLVHGEIGQRLIASG